MKRLFLLGVVLSGFLVACSAGGSGPTPPTGGGGSTATPAPTPTPTASPAQSGTGSVAVSTTASSSATLPPVGGYTGTLGFPTASVATTVAIADQVASVGPPTGVPVLQGMLRRAPTSWGQATTQSGSTNTPLVYLTLTSAANVTFSAALTFTFVLPSSAGTGPFYLGYYSSPSWMTAAGPGTVTGSTVTFSLTGGSSNVQLVGGQANYLALYSGGVIPTPTPTPSPTPVPTASPTPTPTASPTPSTANVIVNGDFETGTLSGWFPCYVQHHQLAQVDANPVNTNTTYNAPTPGPDTAPTASPGPNDVTVAGTTPTGAVHGGSYAGLAGSSTVVTRGKGAVGLCQNVVVPTTTPTLTLWVYEGGDMAYYDGEDAEADVFTSDAGLLSTANTTTELPATTYFSENNCYNNLAAGTGNSAQLPCKTDGTGTPNLATGGVWRQKGPYDMTLYAGQTVTLFLGVWSSTTSTSYYSYAYYDDVVLSNNSNTGSLPITVQKPGVKH